MRVTLVMRLGSIKYRYGKHSRPLTGADLPFWEVRPEPLLHSNRVGSNGYSFA